MELCNLRNDPTGSLRYSQEEGLSKRTIERLPHTRYKKPAASTSDTNAAQAKKGGRDALSSIISSKKKKEAADEEAGGRGRGSGAVVAGEGTGGNVPGSQTVVTAAAAVVAEGGGGDRDSTADMCAICLVEYETGDELRVMPGCGHNFHKVRSCGRACCKPVVQRGFY